jgi:iron complex transport system substrate-binding protein
MEKSNARIKKITFTANITFTPVIRGMRHRLVFCGGNYFAAMLLTGAVCLLPWSAQAEIRATDDAGRAVILDAPAQRIVSLAPFLTELLFAAGAGDAVVGVSGFSDFPPAARAITRIGTGSGLDLERIVALQPDLVVAWQSGNPADQVERLRALGMTVFVSEPRTLGDIGATLPRLGALAGTDEQAYAAMHAYRQRLAALRQRHAGKPPVDVFYQLWDRPLMTVNGDHIISDVIRLCGGRNVFAGLDRYVPQIGIESVLQRDPQVIIAAVAGDGQADVLADWQRWSGMSAVRKGHLYTLPDDLLVRHTPRILDGAEQLCGILDQVREDTL